jgi:hypothetical protein
MTGVVGRVALAAGALMALTLAAFPNAALGDWSASKGPYVVTQTDGDITVTSHAGRGSLFSARAFAAAQYKLLLAEFQITPTRSGASPAMHVRHRFRFMSLTGPLLAIRDEADVDVKANAIPAGKARFWTIDLRRGTGYGFGENPLDPSDKTPGAFVDLRSLFLDKAIAAAAEGSALGKMAASKPGSGLPDVMYDLAQVGRKSPYCFLPDPDPTWSFALGPISASSVAVSLGLPGQSNCRTSLTVLPLALPRSMLRRPLGAQVLAPSGLPAVTVDIGTAREQ